MFFGRLFDSRRKSKAHTDELSSSPASPLSSGTATPTVPNKLRRNRTVSVSTNVAKETHATVRKHLSIAVPRANKTTPLTIILPTPRARAVSVAAPKSPTSTPSSIDVSTRPRSTFESRRAEHAALTQADGDLPPPSSPSSSTDRSARTSVTAHSAAEPSPLASSSSSAISAAPTQASSAPSAPTSALLPGSRPLLRRGSSAPPSVAGVVRAELDADGLHIRDAHAHRPEPILVVPREQVAEFCGVVGVWEEEEEDRDGASDDDARTIVFTAEPESMLPSEGEAAVSVPMAIALPAGALLRPPRATLTRLPATAPSTPNRSQSARYYFARRRAQSLISSHRYHRADLRRKASALVTKRPHHPSSTGSTASIRRRSRTRSSTTRRHTLAIVRSSSTRSTRSARDVPS